jgi:hypothetical protein
MEDGWLDRWMAEKDAQCSSAWDDFRFSGWAIGVAVLGAVSAVVLVVGVLAVLL